MAVSAILENPEDFLGKPVQITGKVVDVCPNRGCWIDVSSDTPYKTITVKVDDGVIVFPITVKGKNVMAEGTLIPLLILCLHRFYHLPRRFHDWISLCDRLPPIYPYDKSYRTNCKTGTPFQL